MQRYRDRGKPTIECRISLTDVEVRGLLDGVGDGQWGREREGGKYRFERVHQVTIHENGGNSESAEPKPPESPEKPAWYQQWWVISLAVGIFVGGLVFFFTSPVYGGVAAVGGMLVMLPLNPERRFFRLGSALLSAAMVNLFESSARFVWEDDKIHLALQAGSTSSTVMTIAFLLAGIVVMVLDAKNSVRGIPPKAIPSASTATGT